MGNHRLQRLQVGTGRGAVNRGTGAMRLTFASPSASSMRMYIQPISNSYHLFDSLAEVDERMMVVVQFLAADQDAPRHDVGAGVLGGPVAIAPDSGRCR